MPLGGKVACNCIMNENQSTLGYSLMADRQKGQKGQKQYVAHSLMPGHKICVYICCRAILEPVGIPCPLP